MKLVLPVLVKETIEHDLVSGKNTVALIDAIENRSIGNVPSLNIDEIQNAPINTPLSPSGFISIAAADIDEANADERLSRQLQNGEIDMELIESLHRISFQGLPQPSTEFSQSIINNLFSLLQGRHLRRTAAASVPVVKENSNIEAIDEEKQVERRFLSLLRRINELRSQQYDVSYLDFIFI
jgi:hypothetical protein